MRKGYKVTYWCSEDLPNTNYILFDGKYYWDIITVKYIYLFNFLKIPYKISFGESDEFKICMVEKRDGN